METVASICDGSTKTNLRRRWSNFNQSKRDFDNLTISNRFERFLEEAIRIFFFVYKMAQNRLRESRNLWVKSNHLLFIIKSQRIAWKCLSIHQDLWRFAIQLGGCVSSGWNPHQKLERTSRNPSRIPKSGTQRQTSKDKAPQHLLRIEKEPQGPRCASKNLTSFNRWLLLVEIFQLLS